MQEIIRKYVLQNAHKFGEVQAGRIIGKVLGENPELKTKAKEVNKTIQEVIDEVALLSKEEIEIDCKINFLNYLKKKRDKKD